MKHLLKIISFTGLAIMFFAAIMVFNDRMSRNVYMDLSLIGTIIWFTTVPFWMKRRLHSDSESAKE